MHHEMVVMEHQLQSQVQQHFMLVEVELVITLEVPLHLELVETAAVEMVVDMDQLLRVKVEQVLLTRVAVAEALVVKLDLIQVLEQLEVQEL